METLNTKYFSRPVTVVGSYTPRVDDIPAVVLVQNTDGYVFPVSVNDVEVTS